MNIWTELDSTGRFLSYASSSDKSIPSQRKLLFHVVIVMFHHFHTCHSFYIIASLYSNRLSIACANSHRRRGHPPLPVGVAAPQVVMAAQPLSMADIHLVR